jgi:secondary thiamine-phosphate synthase enzyme
MIHRVIATQRRIQALDITELILERSWPEGFLWVGVPHTTVALVLSESDPDLLFDLERVAESFFSSYEPFRHRRNDNPNAAAHLFSSLLGTHVVVPIVHGRPALGSYQRLVFLELDGPKGERSVELRPLPAAQPVESQGGE